MTTMRHAVSQATLSDAAERNRATWVFAQRRLPERRHIQQTCRRPARQDFSARAQDLRPCGRTPGFAGLAGIDDDRIVGAEGRVPVGLDHHARAVEPEDDRQPVGDPGAGIAHVEIDPVETSGRHADQDLAFFSLRDGQLVDLQDLVAAVTVNACCEHGFRTPVTVLAKFRNGVERRLRLFELPGECLQSARIRLATCVGARLSMARTCASVPY